MIFYCLGIDYKKTHLAIREFAYSQRAEILRFWNESRRETEVLFTCNRIEIYGVAKSQAVIEKDIYSFKRKFFPLFEQVYLKLGLEEVISHALRLALGLESQILAEKQIFKQIDSWIKKDSFSWSIKNIWLEVLARAEKLYQELGLDKLQSSLSDIVLEDLIFNTGWGQRKRVLVVGTGKVAKDFSETKFPNIDLYFFARKKIKKARRLAKNSKAKAFLLEDLSRELIDADSLIAATSSPHYILRKEFLAKSLELRKRPLYIYDLALPRDIEPEAADIPGVFLKNLEDLAENFKRRNERLFKSRQPAQSTSFTAS